MQEIMLVGQHCMNALITVVYIINLNKNGEHRRITMNKKIASGWENFARLIIENRGNVHAKNNLGWTPLQHSAVTGKKCQTF